MVEDWSWAHHPGFQSPDAPFADQPALTNLLLEQVLALGSHDLIAEIRVLRFVYLLRKAEGDAPGITSEDIWDIRSRGRTLNPI